MTPTIRLDHTGVVGEVAQYEDFNRYGYVRGPAGVIIGLVEELR